MFHGGLFKKSLPLWSPWRLSPSLWGFDKKALWPYSGPPPSTPLSCYCLYLVGEWVYGRLSRSRRTYRYLIDRKSFLQAVPEWCRSYRSYLLSFWVQRLSDGTFLRGPFPLTPPEVDFSHASLLAGLNRPRQKLNRNPSPWISSPYRLTNLPFPPPPFCGQGISRIAGRLLPSAGSKEAGGVLVSASCILGCWKLRIHCVLSLSRSWVFFKDKSSFPISCSGRR